MSHAFSLSCILAAASRIAAAAELASLQQVRRLQLQLHEAGVTSVDWDFVPLAFDTLGAPWRVVTNFVQEHARRIASKCSVPMADAQRRIEQLLSNSTWSSTAQAIISRVPSPGVDCPTSIPC